MEARDTRAEENHYGSRMKATKIGHRWQIIDGNDFVMVWLDEKGFHSQRVTNSSSGNPIGHEATTIEYFPLILAAEKQLPLEI